MTAGGARLRLCPFCGATGEPILKRSGAACFVYCNVCYAEGPLVKVFDHMPDPSETSEAENINSIWDAAEKSASEEAAHKWNFRPWEGYFTPEDLEEFERRQEDAVH